LLGSNGIQYSEDFNYYEKAGLDKIPFPMLPPGASKCTGALCGGDKKPTKKPCDPATESAAVKAMEGAEKARQKQADAEMKAAKADVAKAKATMARDAIKAKEKIAKLRIKDASLLTEAEKKMLAQANEKMAKREETLKLQFASSEIRDKASGAKRAAKRSEERATKEAYGTTERSKRAAERELKAGHKATDMELEKMALNDAEFKAVHEDMKSKNAKADEDLKLLKAKSSVSGLKEQESKEVAQKKAKLKSEGQGGS
jgi:colicin import membrane protein